MLDLNSSYRYNSLATYAKASYMVGLVQLVRAPVCGTGSHGFESHIPPHFFILTLHWGVAKG